jgi:hypothetical protein
MTTAVLASSASLLENDANEAITIPKIMPVIAKESTISRSVNPFLPDIRRVPDMC